MAMDEEPEIRMQIRDVKEDAILLLAFGVRKNRPPFCRDRRFRHKWYVL